MGSEGRRRQVRIKMKNECIAQSTLLPTVALSLCSMYTRIVAMLAQPKGPVKSAAVARATVHGRIPGRPRPSADRPIRCRSARPPPEPERPTELRGPSRRCSRLRAAQGTIATWGGTPTDGATLHASAGVCYHVGQQCPPRPLAQTDGPGGPGPPRGRGDPSLSDARAHNGSLGVRSPIIHKGDSA